MKSSKKVILKSIISILILTVFIVSLSSCSIIKIFAGDEVNTCIHSYGDWIMEVAPTCETDGNYARYCSKCNAKDSVTKNIPALGHSYDSGVSVDGVATCQVEGNVLYTCLNCGKTKTEVAKLNHTPLNKDVYIYDTTYHWQECQWCSQVINKAEHTITEEIITQYDCTHDGESRYSCSCGMSRVDTHKAEHYYAVKNTVEPTCQNDGYIEYEKCPGCNGTKENTILEKVDHKYEAETCIYCERDMLLDCVSKFKGHGESSYDLIEINSDEELRCLANYAVFYNTIRYFNINYSTGSANEFQYISEVLSTFTAANCGIRTQSGVTGTKQFYSIQKSTDNDSTRYSKKPGVDYTNDTYTEIYNVAENSYTQKRADTFSDFKYKNRINSLSVSTSDQLYYAFAHGYKPTVVANSKAEQVLNDIEAIMREIVDDSMSDFEKLYQIYMWMISNVEYDHAAVTVTNNGEIEWENIYSWSVEGVIYGHVAVCDAMSKAICIMAGIEDIKCIEVSGNSHAWNKVYIDANNDGKKEWYTLDATHANPGLRINNKNYELGVRVEFLRTDAYKTTKGYTAVDYLDVTANTKVNVFKSLYYGTGKTSSNDFYIESDSELTDLIKYYKSTIVSYLNSGKQVSIDFVLKQASSIDSTAIYSALGISSIGVNIQYTYENNYIETGDTWYLITLSKK